MVFNMFDTQRIGSNVQSFPHSIKVKYVLPKSPSVEPYSSFDFIGSNNEIHKTQKECPDTLIHQTHVGHDDEVRTTSHSFPIKTPSVCSQYVDI